MIQIVKKPEMAPKQAMVLRIVAVLAAIVASGLIILLLGHNPIEVFVKIFKGSLTTKHGIRQTINYAIPLVILSLGVAVAFKMKFWNIGAEGQLYMGAMGASFIAYYFSELPPYVMIPLMMLVGILCGGLWALVPAVLKSSFGTNETLVTLMMNYVAQKFIAYLEIGPWRNPDAGGQAVTRNFTENAILPKVFGIHIGWIIALILVVVIHILLTRTKLGYEIAVLGENPQTARYAGMSISKILIVSVLISGGLCGLVGMMQASAIETKLTDTLSGGFGFTAIITAYLAQLSAPAILVVSSLFAALLQGGEAIRVSMQIPAAVTEVIQGVILLFILASEFFTNYRLVWRRDHRKEASK